MNVDSIASAADAAFRKGEFAEAERLYRCSTSEPPDPALLFKFGICKLAIGEPGWASKLFEQAVELEPDSARAYVGLACSLEIRGETSEAMKQYRKAIILAPDSAVACANLGYLTLAQGNATGALARLRRALTGASMPASSVLLLPTVAAESLPQHEHVQDGASASSACLLLGLKLRESGRFEDARMCFERALSLDIQNGPAYYALAYSGKITAADVEIVQRMSDLAASADLPEEDRGQMLFALGKAMDDLGEYESAMSYFERANRIAVNLSQPGFDRKDFAADIESVIQTYTRDRIEAMSNVASASERPLFIVGMMRSGTTLVEQILSSHPDVAAAGELMFWKDSGYRYLRAQGSPPTAKDAVRLADSYESCVREIDPDARRVTDKMPQNFVAIGLIRMLFPNARFVCCRRNPVDVCLSIFMTSFRYPLPFANERGDIVFFYKQFVKLMEHWKTVIPTDRLMDVTYEELLADRERNTRGLVEFCGLDWDDRCLSPEKNRREVKTASAWQVRQRVYSSAEQRWRNYEPWLGEFRELLPRAS